MGSNAYVYCKSKLQSFVTELKLRKDDIRFHFYFGDSLELCQINEEWNSKFHVIHCSIGCVRHARLSNIFPVTGQCLNGKIPESVLVTDFFIESRKNEKTMSLVKSVESNLCCPLSMIPTVFGMRLLDDLCLGNPETCQLHDHFFFKTKHTCTLKWPSSLFRLMYVSKFRLP